MHDGGEIKNTLKWSFQCARDARTVGHPPRKATGMDGADKREAMCVRDREARLPKAIKAQMMTPIMSPRCQTWSFKIWCFPAGFRSCFGLTILARFHSTLLKRECLFGITVWLESVPDFTEALI